MADNNIKNNYNHDYNHNSLLRFLIRVNRIIFILIFVVCGFTLSSPYLGEINYTIKHIIASDYRKKQELKEKELDNIFTNLLTQNNLESNQGVVERREEDTNKIYIPSIDLESDVLELSKLEDLHTGVWRRPETSTPDMGGNTVMIAHRYTRKGGESGPNTFYHLPKVQIDDNIFVSYNGVGYKYKVYDVQVLSADATYIEDATTTADLLTLYTCTPLWSASERHVVFAKLISPVINNKITNFDNLDEADAKALDVNINNNN